MELGVASIRISLESVFLLFDSDFDSTDLPVVKTESMIEWTCMSPRLIWFPADQ